MMDDLTSPQALVALLPLLAAGVLAFVPRPLWGGWIVLGASAATFGLACRLPFQQGRAGSLLLADPLSAHMAMLTSFVGLVTAWFSRGALAQQALAAQMTPVAVRHYHALFMAFLGFMLLALLADNLGVAWVGIEAATIGGVVAVGLPRTPGAVEAAWKYFVVGGVGVALALFGIVALYLAAGAAHVTGLAGMSWTALAVAAPSLPPALLNLAFVFLLVGYATKAGLAPLHTWLADAHAEGPVPLSAVLAGSVLNVALVSILRLRGIVAANPGAIAPGPPIEALGVASVLLAALALWRRRDMKRFFAMSSIEQNGLVALAFGIGGAPAVFAGMLHMTLHTLTKAALFMATGHAAQLKGSQRLDAIGGLGANHRPLALTFAAGIAAVAALPPFGMFTSAFLILTAAVQRAPVAAALAGVGVMVGVWALLAKLIALCLGEPTPDAGPGPPPAALLPAWLLLAVVLAAGVALPSPVAGWLGGIAAAQR